MDMKVATVKPLTSRRVPLKRGQLIRLLVVGIFAAGLFARSLPDVMRVVQPLGVFGYSTDGSGRVTSVSKGSPAAQAHLHVGDQIRIDLVPLEDRKPGLVHNAYSWYNWTRHLQVQRGKKIFPMTMEAVPEQPVGRFVVAWRALTELMVVVIGSLLVIVRPSLATWGFFLFCIGGGHQSTFLDTILPYPWRPIENGIADAINAAANVGLLIFAFLFVLSASARTKMVIGLAAIAVWCVSAALAAYADLALTYGGRQTATLVTLSHYLQDTLVAAALAVFIVTFIRSRGETRQRIGWIVAAFVVSLAARVIGDWLFPAHIPGWLYGILQSLQVLPASAVAWGVIQKRIFDVDFVVSRALVFVALIGALVSVFAVVDEGLSYYLVMNTDFAYAIILVVCFLSSLFIGRARDFISHFVDRVFFRERQAMRKHLMHISRTLPLIADRELVDRFLIDDVCVTLDLRSAAMFERREDGSFQASRTIGWPTGPKPVLEPNDPMIAHAEQTWAPLDLGHDRWKDYIECLHGITPVLALPLIVAQRLEVVLVYGVHASGVDLDPDEIQLLSDAAGSAAVALSNLRMLALEKRVYELEALRLDVSPEPAT